MADRHRILVRAELEQLRAGRRGEWSGRAVGGLARILTRRHSDRWDGLALDRLATAAFRGDRREDDEGLAEIVAWTLDWLRVVGHTPPIVAARAAVAATLRARDAFARYNYVSGAVHTAEAAAAYCDLASVVRAGGGWVERATLEHVERLVDLALEWTERVREARRGRDELMVRWVSEDRGIRVMVRLTCRALRQTRLDAW